MICKCFWGTIHFQYSQFRMFPRNVNIECEGLIIKRQTTIICTHHFSFYKLKVIQAYLTVVIQYYALSK